MTLRGAFEWSGRTRRANVSARSAWTSRIFAAPWPSPSGKAPLNFSPCSTLSCADRVSIRSASIVTSASIASTTIATGAAPSRTIAREAAPGSPSRSSKARRLTTGRTAPRRFATPMSALGACGTRAVAGIRMTSATVSAGSAYTRPASWKTRKRRFTEPEVSAMTALVMPAASARRRETRSPRSPPPDRRRPAPVRSRPPPPAGRRCAPALRRPRSAARPPTLPRRSPE